MFISIKLGENMWFSRLKKIPHDQSQLDKVSSNQKKLFEKLNVESINHIDV